ncbi:MAG: ABC transporter ATP-binding protein [Limnochordia bacterium]|jgi:putative ABC transport system ATP-binding protein
MTDNLPIDIEQELPLPSGEEDETFLARLVGIERIFRLGDQQVHALRGIDLDIQEGTFVLLSGRSGSGKTTLLNILGGLDRPTRGKVFFRGKDLGTFSERALTKWRRKEIGFVFQSFALLPTLTAHENVELPLRIVGGSGRQRRARARECLEMVGLWKRARHRVFELSGGEQQRVCIARALTTKPGMLLADEPTGELDTVTGKKILALFRDIVQYEGITVCMVTHDPGAAPFADTVYSLVDGQIA